MSSTFLKRNWFPLAIVAVVVLGIALARLGLSIPAGATTLANRALVIGLFSLVGLTLPTESILRDLRDWRLHAYLQLCIFVASPLLFALAALPFRGAMDGMVQVGFYALGCLPTTVTSCIVFTQTSEGNVVGSTFNAALSNVAGVFLSPLILSLFLQGSGRSLPPEEIARIIKNLALTMAAPIAAGQLARIWLRSFAVRHKSGLGAAMNCLMLVVVFLALFGAASNETFVSALAGMIMPFLVLAAANVLMTALYWAGGRAIGLSAESRISVLFVAPQKTLAMGAPLLATYFAGSPQVLGIALLPLLFYHPWQLIVASVVRSLLGRGDRKG
jgi:solute carrier family 10 (sodium/bile acid cotransporter), member 7